MGLDPFTSTAIAEVAADKTGNDGTIPAVVTAGPYGPAANSAYNGDTALAAQQGLAATGAVATGGIAGAQAGAGAAGAGGGGAGASIYPSLIAGGSDLLGVVLNRAMEQKQARPGPIIANPAYQELMNRYLGIMDAYMQKHGIKPYVAANGGGGAPGATPPIPPVAPAAPAAAPTIPIKPFAASTPAQPPPPPATTRSSDGQDASLAASLGARRLGIKTDAPRLQTTRAAFEQNQGQKEQQVNDIYDYIYSQRRLGAA